MLNNDSSKCPELSLTRTASYIALVGCISCMLIICFMWWRQRQYIHNIEMLVTLGILFLTETIAAIFALVSANAFRIFLGDVDNWILTNPSNGQEMVVGITWKFGYSWVLLVVTAVFQLLMIFMTIYLYRQKNIIQEDLEQQLFI